MILRLTTLLLVLLASAFALAAPVKTEHVEAELVPERLGVAPGGSVSVALRLRMQEHWHTYWKNPGDSGLPTRIKWQLPEGFSAGPIQWPHPHRLPTGPLMNYGYEGEVLLVSDLQAPASLVSVKPGDSVTINGRADWLVCKDVCIPENAQLTLTLPVVGGEAPVNAAWQTQFAAARAAQPQAQANIKIDAGSDGKTLDLRVMPARGAGSQIARVEFFPERGDVIHHAAAQTLVRDGAGLRLRVPLAATPPKDFNTIAGVLVADAAWDASGATAIAIEAPLGAALPPAQGDSPVSGLGGSAINNSASAAPAGASATALNGALPPTFWIAIAFALIGGLILNLMPCVFPVLGIKIMGFVERAHDERRVLRTQGLMFTLGVLAAFLALAGAMLTLRAGGAQIGWGFQLQSPLFVTMLACLFFLLALNLSGVFDVGASAQRLAGSVAGRRGLRADAFVSGLLAAAVATPCTAPFMGAAIGYTLAQSSAATLAIFAALALGMAAPVLLLSWFPKWLRLLPKPGRWMETFKQVMAFPLYATVIWLAWVLGAQAGNDAVARLMLGLLLLATAAWTYGRWSLSSKFLPMAAAALLAIAGIGLAWPGKIHPGAAASNALTASGDWHAWSPEKVAQLRAQGKPVFVDFTAAWCITCQVNKRVALNRDEVLAAFKSRDVALLRADWTAQDPAITQALAALGRNAVPVYALYPADGAAAPVLLPEVLTVSTVVEAVRALPATNAARVASPQ